jgi:DNA mismatch repair protein MutS
VTAPDPLKAERKLASETPAMTADGFESILFPNGESPAEIDSLREPECFSDLHLDQVVETATAGRAEYHLEPFFFAPSRDVSTIHYRQDVFRDLENPTAAVCVRVFAAAMQQLRGQLAQAEKHFYVLQRRRFFLDAVDGYCRALRRVADGLAAAEFRSAGLNRFRQYLADAIDARNFRDMESEAGTLIDALGQVRYALLIDGKRITVGRCQPEPDYGADVLQTFEKFRQGSSKDYRFNFRFTAEMNHVEAAILDRVALLYPEVFSLLEAFCAQRRGFLNPVLARFDREVQFYLAWSEYAQRFKDEGLSCCYPAVSNHPKQVSARDAFDPALAEKLRTARDGKAIVTNEFSVTGVERIIVVTGPNQGGKTTFARMFGQLLHLARLGCPVPAKEASLFLCDRLFTHFEKEEDVENLTGKLEDELLRIHRILESATPDSILIMNESFLSTTLNDALFLSRQVMERIVELDVLCVSVTFLDELASLSRSTVSMVATVDPIDPARRTFKIIRKPADGLAYAVAIAEKYRLTHDDVKARITRNAGEGGA